MLWTLPVRVGCVRARRLLGALGWPSGSVRVRGLLGRRAVGLLKCLVVPCGGWGFIGSWLLLERKTFVALLLQPELPVGMVAILVP